MGISELEKNSSDKVFRKNKAIEIADTSESLITALILALVFIEFTMEAFRIPTGSMADTLKGAHFRMCCTQCGYKYDYGFTPQDYRLCADTVPSYQVAPPRTQCPSCGYYQPSDKTLTVSNGDRILVLKCAYQFFEPKRWDVVVFKNPPEPTINYIKRLIGRPGETVEIIDGDIYIDGQICRKPPKVQQELWMPVYDNDYQPVHPQQGRFNGHAWQQPFRNSESSRWVTDSNGPTHFHLDSSPEQVNTMVYDTTTGNDFRTTYAYDEVERNSYMPYCSDLMVRFYVESSDAEGGVGIELGKYENRYKARVDLSGKMILSQACEGEDKELASDTVEPMTVNRPVPIRFANVDHRLIFEFGDKKIIHNLGEEPNSLGARRTDIEPKVKISGSGNLVLSHVAVFRDIHYIQYQLGTSGEAGRATEGRPFKLDDDEFFVLGDNSPNSEDGRWWNRPGRGNNGVLYREGIVPRDYLIGKAFFVTWPAGFKPFFRFPVSIIPDVEYMRFIYGGSNRNL